MEYPIEFLAVLPWIMINFCPLIILVEPIFWGILKSEGFLTRLCRLESLPDISIYDPGTVKLTVDSIRSSLEGHGVVAALESNWQFSLCLEKRISCVYLYQTFGRG